MVCENEQRKVNALTFQYSLCRVVLMVRLEYTDPRFNLGSFSTRSVESF